MTEVRVCPDNAALLAVRIPGLRPNLWTVVFTDGSAGVRSGYESMSGRQIKDWPLMASHVSSDGSPGPLPAYDPNLSWVVDPVTGPRGWVQVSVRHAPSGAVGWAAHKSEQYARDKALTRLNDMRMHPAGS